MSRNALSRRLFLKTAGVCVSAAAVSACAPATPTETAPPSASVAPTTATAATAAPVAEVSAGKYSEAPQLAELVAAGSLPPVEERLPKEPMVIPVTEEIGQYGGTWHRVAVGPSDAWAAGRLAYENLLRWSADGSGVIPNACETYEISEDATEFTFHLREGLRWSDGEPFTADDLVFFYEDGLKNTDLYPSFPKQFRDPKNDEPMVLEKIDDYTVRIKFASPYGLFIQMVASPVGATMVQWPAHYLKQFHPNYTPMDELLTKAKERQFDNWWQLFGDRRNRQNPEYPQLAAWIPTRVPPDIPVLFERNPYYGKVDSEGNQLPYIDRIQVDVVENADLLNLKAVAGEVDMQLRHIIWTNFPLFVENAEQGAYRILQWTAANGSNALLFPNMNHKDPGLRELLGNLDFRIALSHGINREEIKEIAYTGMGEARQASLIPQSPYFKPEHATRYAEYDPDQANAILDELGLTERDGEGYRLRRDGTPLLLVIEYHPIFGPYRDVMTMISEQWKAIGIHATPKEEDRALLSERAGAGETDISVGEMDYCFTPLVAPDRFIPFGYAGIYESNAVLWYAWYTSGGTEGEEPPPEVKRQYELYDLIKGASPEELPGLAEEFFDNASVNLWNIGVVGLLPQIVIVKSNFRNVPEDAISDYQQFTPGNTNIEQYFFKQA